MPCQNAFELLKHLLIREFPAPFDDDPLSGEEERRFHNPLERALGSDPVLRRISDVLLLQLEGRAVINIVANILLVGEHLMNCAPTPRAVEIGADSFRVERICNLGFRKPLPHKGVINPPHIGDLFLRTTNEYDPVCLEALLFAYLEHPFVLTGLVDQHPA